MSFIITNTAWAENFLDIQDEETLTSGAMTIFANGVCLTRNVSRRTNSLRDEVILSAYPIALWMSSSWWRLLYESLPSNEIMTPQWRMSHELAAAGSGYAWPRITFISDGNGINIFSHPKSEQDTIAEPLFYTGAKDQRVIFSDFENAIDAFISQAILHIERHNQKQSELAAVWEELQTERHDPEQRWYRIIEAKLGFEPDDAPQKFMQDIVKKLKKFDDSVILELATLCNMDEEKNIDERLEAIVDMSRKGIQGKWTLTDFSSGSNNIELPPWEYGRLIARNLRQYLGKMLKKIDSSTLYDILGLSKEKIKNFIPHNATFSISSCTDKDMKINIKKESSYFYTVGLRFQLARLIGAYLSAEPNEQWLPVTPCKTWKQKVQRAFATEFLSPISEVREMVGGIPTEQSIRKAAKHFLVSPQTILHGLANHGDIAKDDLLRFAFQH